MKSTTPVCLLKPREAADVLGICARSLWTLTQREELPCVRIGRSVRYDMADLVAFIEAKKNKASN
jgi:excisionase family DNA binding protein